MMQKLLDFTAYEIPSYLVLVLLSTVGNLRYLSVVCEIAYNYYDDYNNTTVYLP